MEYLISDIIFLFILQMENIQPGSTSSNGNILKRKRGPPPIDESEFCWGFFQ